MNADEKLAALRAILQASGVEGFLLPVADEYLGEYVPPSAQRLAWLTGFTGSAGMAAALPERAALFVDGRYTLQARAEVDARLYAQHNSAETKPEAWLAKYARPGSRIGYDPMLHSIDAVERLEKALSDKEVALTPLVPNPVDTLWADRPAPPQGQAFIHPLTYAGIPHAEKCAAAAQALREHGADACILAASDSINWLLNIRGRDLAYTPVVLAYAMLDAEGNVQLFAAPAKFSGEVLAHLGGEVAVLPQDALPDALGALGAGRKRVLLDPQMTPAWFFDALRASGAEIVRGEDPCVLPKAVKNGVELEGARRAHRRDGLAVTRFLHWLDAETRKRAVTEMDAAARLLDFRRCAPEFFSPSFETIAGSGPNGAIVHYRVSAGSNRPLKLGELFLLDSGAQYPDGTTDITRTVAIGTPTKEQRERFTRVLAGHIALALARFPEGATGAQLDALARYALWQAGMDYDHGTGHGVGSFLSVHEGPQRIGKQARHAAPLKAGMIVSNEPGYYKEGAYGIRIESLVAVVTHGRMESKDMPCLGFETLTCAPIDRRLIAPGLLSRPQKRWLNAYHRWVYATHAPLLTHAQRRWLWWGCRRVW